MYIRQAYDGNEGRQDGTRLTVIEIFLLP